MNSKYILLELNLFLLSFACPVFVHADSQSDSGLISFSIPLIANAWNLVSIPVNVPDENVISVLGNATSSVDTILMYAPENSVNENGWQTYRATKPELSTLKIIQPGYGYFIHTTSAATINGRGTLFLGSSTPPLRHLVTGWNVVGAFESQSTTSIDIDQGFSSIGFSGVDYLALWGLDPSTQSFTTPESVKPGDAMWILLDAPHIYGPTTF